MNEQENPVTTENEETIAPPAQPESESAESPSVPDTEAMPAAAPLEAAPESAPALAAEEVSATEQDVQSEQAPAAGLSVEPVMGAEEIAPASEPAPPKVKAVKKESKQKPKVEKSVKPPKAEKSEKAVKPKADKIKTEKAKTEKVVKPKMVRDSFTMPETDYVLIAGLKLRCATNGAEVKKSELLRLGLQALARMADDELVSVAKGLDKLKTGRPKKA